MIRLALTSLALLAGCQLTPAGADRAPRPAVTRPRAPARTAPPPQLAASRVSISVRDATVGEALAAIGRQIGRNIVCEPGIEDRVTLTLHDVHWSHALELVLDWTQCEVRELGEVLYVTQPPRVTLQGLCF
jgi:type II secretory pathway component HofQ